MKYSKKVSASQKQNIFFIQGKTKLGFDCYYYVLVKPEKLPLLEDIKKGGDMKISDYGTVIEKGYGEPDEAVKEFMFTEYGFQ